MEHSLSDTSRAALTALLLSVALPTLPGQRELPAATSTLIQALESHDYSEMMSPPIEYFVLRHRRLHGIEPVQAATDELCERVLMGLKSPDPAFRKSDEFYRSFNALSIILRLRGQIGTTLDEKIAVSLRSTIRELSQSEPTSDPHNRALNSLLLELVPNEKEIIKVLDVLTNATLRFHDCLVQLREAESSSGKAPNTKRLPAELEELGGQILTLSSTPFSQFMKDAEFERRLEFSRRIQSANLERLINVDGANISTRQVHGLITAITGYATFCAQCNPATQRSVAAELVNTLRKEFPVLSPEDTRYFRGFVVSAVHHLPLLSISADEMLAILTALKSEMTAQLDTQGAPTGMCIESALSGLVFRWCDDPRVIEGLTEIHRGRLVELLGELEAMTIREPERGKQFVMARKLIDKVQGRKT